MNSTQDAHELQKENSRDEQGAENKIDMEVKNSRKFF